MNIENLTEEAKQVKLNNPKMIVSVAEKGGKFSLVIQCNRRTINDLSRKGYNTYEYVSGKFVRYSHKLA